MEDYSARFTANFSVSGHDLDTLKGFLNFLINRAKDGRSTPYGLLVQYETYDQYENFLRILEEILQDFPAPSYQMVGAAEKAVVSNCGMLSRTISRNHIFALLHCEEEGEIDSLVRELKYIPDVIKIVGASEKIIEHRFQSDAEFRYRMLPRMVRLNKMKSDAAAQQFLYQITKKYETSETFERDISYYINTIYDEADYQELEFVQDLILRIERQMEEQEGIDEYLLGRKTIDESFVPFSLKVQQRKEEQDKIEVAQAEKCVDVKITNEDTGRSDSAVPSGSASVLSEDIPVNESEAHVQKSQTAENPHTDVMILAMSTFPFSGKISKNTFTVDAEPELKIIGRSQLDPISKYVASKLEKEGECLDKIIILATDPTRDAQTVTTPEGEKICISPVDYFKKQIRGYLNPDGFENPEEFDKKRFRVIPVSEEKPAQGMQEIMKELRMIPAEQLRLHMTVNGGLRGVQRILEAMIMLLRVENITICGAYSTEIGKNKIIDETERLKIFHFVSGMNEFHYDGKINALSGYLTGNNELTTAIQLVSDGISWCNVQVFEQGLKKLNTFFTKSSNIKDPYLHLFEESIRQDYDTLLGKSISVLDEIKWCLRKEFYQQALTFLESRMSEMLVRWGTLTISTDAPSSGPGQSPYHLKSERNHYYLVNERGSKYTKGNKPIKIEINLLFNALVYGISKKPLSYADFNSMSEHDLQHLVSYANRTCGCGVETDQIYNDYTVILDLPGKPEVWKPFKIKKSDVLIRYLFLHKILKNVRNDMNHAQEFHYDQKKIRLALNYYISWAEELKNQK